MSEEYAAAGTPAAEVDTGKAERARADRQAILDALRDAPVRIPHHELSVTAEQQVRIEAARLLAGQQFVGTTGQLVNDTLWLANAMLTGDPAEPTPF